MIRILFGLIASLGLLMALGTVLARNLVHAALYLVGFFFLVACTFILLEAEFLALMQVLVYIGAVAILLLFGIMLTRNIQGDETTGVGGIAMAVGGVVALGVLAVLIVGIVDESGGPGRSAWRQTTVRPPVARADDPAADPRSRAINNMGKAVGDEMMTRFVVPFEVAGLMLTAVLVGAIAIAVGEGTEETPRRGPLTAARPGVGGDGNGAAGPSPAALLTTTG
ncbi:MAG: NADH-quinone oxidoreductase subunit J, partial [Isosphaeraceae bacterium]|nr:NADH-quinone oxidoreductase subunit J [Isosphaeraceae bacterium]